MALIQITFPDWSRTGLVRGTTGTAGPVRARATPAQSRTGPVRACPWFTHSMVKWTLPIRPRLNPVRDLSGHTQLHPMVDHADFAQYCPASSRTGFIRACPASSHGILGFAIWGSWLPVQISHGARTGFDRACPYGAYHGIWPGAHQDLSGPRTGMPVMPHGRPYKSRTGPGRDLKGHPFDLAMGKPWAIPYGAHTGFKRGCPCSDWPWCARGAPYQSRTGSGRERYLGLDHFDEISWILREMS